MNDPLDFYGYEDESNARAYRRRRRLQKISKWRREQYTVIDSAFDRVMGFVRNTIVGMPAIG